MIVPFTSYSQKLPTKTLQPHSFIKEDGKSFYTFDSEQTRFFYETKMLYDICNKKTLYKDSIIETKTKIIEEITSLNKDSKIELDSCSSLVNKQINLISKQDTIIKNQQKNINRKNIQLSFLSGTTLAIIIAMIFL